METWLVTYDIRDAKRLRKVAKACEDFGERRQYSVFSCRISARDLIRLKARLHEILDLKADQVLFIPLCDRCAAGIEAMGQPTEKYDSRDMVIIA